MLLRFYRLTDKLGIVLLKLATEATRYLMSAATVVTGVVRGGFRGVFAAIWSLIRLILGAFRWIFGRLSRLLRWMLSLIGIGAVRVQKRAGKVVNQAGSSASTAMARRAEESEARAQMDVGLTEDPLRVQNRALSVLLVVMGFVLVGAIVWATSPNRTPVQTTLGLADPSNVSFAADAPPTPTTASIINTPVPTATPIPSILQVRGSIAYTAVERGQTDIWAVDVGSSTPIRLTNNPADERDPVWSPDGRQLAYAGRQDGNWEIYVYDLISGETIRLTYDLSFQAAPAWSPDGAFLVYESYQGNNLDIYIVAVDGSELPIRLTDHPAPDFSPKWSPDGRRVAFTSWRSGNQDIHLFSLDDPRDEASVNLTNTLGRHEDYASWSPDGDLIAYSALDEGLEKVFVEPIDDPDVEAQVLARGREPSWSPDGLSLVFAVDSAESTHLVAEPFAETGVSTEIVPVLRGASAPNWTGSPLPAPIVNDGGVPAAIPDDLFIEQEVAFDADPVYRLNTLVNVEAPNPVLSDRVNDSFNALREEVLEAVGYDFLGSLEDAFWRIDRPPQPGEERRNWHMTGRAFAINRNAIVGFPPPIEIVREDIGVNTYWRVYVRVAESAQNGQLGEPLRHMPWDFASRNQGDVEAYDQGGRLRTEMPDGYYIDLTELAAAYGWERVPAGRDWRANFNSTNFWMFQKRDDLAWYDAMRELYTEAQLGGFAPQATSVPSAPQQDLQILPTIQPSAASDDIDPATLGLLEEDDEDEPEEESSDPTEAVDDETEE